MYANKSEALHLLCFVHWNDLKTLGVAHLFTFFDFSLCSFGRRGRLRSSGWLGEGNSIPEQEDLQTELDPTLPSTEDVICKTEQITKNIQELLRAAQDNKHDRSGWRRAHVIFSLLVLSSISNPPPLIIFQLVCYFDAFCPLFPANISPSHSASTRAVLLRYSLASPSFAVCRPCEREGVRRLRHSLGCFSTLVPWAEKASSPLQPLSLRSPNPTSWYSGLCPCLPGTVLFSSFLYFLCWVSPANKLCFFFFFFGMCLYIVKLSSVKNKKSYVFDCF